MASQGADFINFKQEGEGGLATVCFSQLVHFVISLLTMATASDSPRTLRATVPVGQYYTVRTLEVH